MIKWHNSIWALKNIFFRVKQFKVQRSGLKNPKLSHIKVILPSSQR